MTDFVSSSIDSFPTKLHSDYESLVSVALYILTLIIIIANFRVMSTFSDVLTLSDSEEEDDEDDLEIISESIVTAKPSLVMELTPVEERRLLEQLNLPKDAVVKIRVVGGGNKCDLVGGGRIANCTVTRDGEVLREKSLQSRKIFGPIKNPQQAADLSKLSEILIISDEESEPDLSPFKKVTLRKRQAYPSN